MKKLLSVLLVTLGLLVASGVLFTCSTDTSDASASNTVPEIQSDEDERNLNYTGRYDSYQYKLANLPPVATLYEVDSTYGAGNETGEYAILYAQGGPALTLSDGYDILFDGFNNSKTLAEPSKWTAVKVHQYQTLYNNFAKSAEITIAQATQYASFSAAVLFAVARHFYQQGKKVYIIGHSYGSLVIPKMIADYKYEQYVEKILMTAGRLQMPGEFTDIFKNGSVAEFQDDGTGLYRAIGPQFAVTAAAIEQLKQADPTTFEEYKDSPYQTTQELLNVVRSEKKLQAALAQFDYVDIYTTHKVPTTKLYLASAKKDEAVGYFIDTEIAFANNSAGGYHISEEDHALTEQLDINFYIDVLEGRK